MAKRNIYDMLAKIPAMEKAEMVIEQEALAEKLVRSGRFRIDAGEQINFIRFSIPQENIYDVYSYRELHEPELQPKTLQSITAHLEKSYSGKALEQKAQSELRRLQSEVDKMLKVPLEMEMKLARAVVQSAHPSVMMLIIWEEVQVFVSFSHSIGDVLDIESWQSMGANSGMQSTAGRRKYAIYTSSNGNPFLPEDYVGGGKHGQQALARLMVIIAQEIGHFADIMRNQLGQPISRHSANIEVSQPKENVRIGRLRDIEYGEKVGKLLYQCGLKQAMEAEKSARYYAKHREGQLIHKRAEAKRKREWKKLKRRAARQKLTFVEKFPDHDKPAIRMHQMVGDMLFNLSPVADVYRSDDPVQEEAIACAEALAPRATAGGEMGPPHDLFHVSEPVQYLLRTGHPRLRESF